MTSDNSAETTAAGALSVDVGFLGKQELEANWDMIFPRVDCAPEVDKPSEADWGKNPASIDLHLGPEHFTTELGSTKRLTPDRPLVTVARGHFALLMTREHIEMPSNVLGFITMRYGYKRQGIINVSGFHVDPGFRGHLIYAVYNAGPSDLQFKLDDAVFSIFFSRLASTPSEKLIREPQESISRDSVNDLSGGRSSSIVAVEARVAQLEVFRSVAIGAFIAIAAPGVFLALELLTR